MPLRSFLPPIDQKQLGRWRASLKDQDAQRELLKLLAKVPLFADTTESFRLGIGRALVPVEYVAGQVVVKQGERHEWLGILVSGQLDRLLSRGEGEGEVRIGNVRPGGIIGDLGLLGILSNMGATIKAASSSTLLCLERRTFWDVVSDCGGWERFPLFQEAMHLQGFTADTESFCGLECFQNLDRGCVIALCQRMEPQLLYPKTVLIRENNYGNEMYILQRGEVAVEVGGKKVANLWDGSVVGEVAVLGGQKRRCATVTCTTLSLIYVLHGDVFHETLSRFPNAKRMFDHGYIKRLVHLDMTLVQEEFDHYNGFYGRATPMSTAEYVEKVQATPAERVPGVARIGSKMAALPTPSSARTLASAGGMIAAGTSDSDSLSLGTNAPRATPTPRRRVTVEA